MTTVRYLGLFAGLWGVCASASPQQGVAPPILSVETNLVTLSVTVVDRRGVFVTGLRQEDFSVYDNGERRTIQFFTSEDVPATIGLVIDSSASMRGRREQITAAAAALAALSHPLDELFTLNFNEAVWLGLPPPVAFTADRDQLRAALSAAPAQGMSALYDAVDRALDHLRLGTRDRKALIVVSDGGDNASAHSLDAVVEHARRSSAVIYSVMLFDPDDHDARPRVLKKLAHDTGGHAFTPASADDVMSSFAQIAQDLRSGYTIGFLPPDLRDGGFRSLRVVADGGNQRQLIARTRAGYYAGP
ncbi:MAG TPA: VWA domain-containing protein [Vicinamibacterales bacterium]|nr:VWA domain-containing protein [Vicinamibacterales bacterium]